MEGVKKILVVTLSNIGDVILTLPVIGVLQESFKAAAIDVVVGPRVREIFEKDPRIGRTYIYDKASPLSAKINLLWQLRRRRYDILVDLRNSLFSLFVNARFSGKPANKTTKGTLHKIDEHLTKIGNLGLSAQGKPYPIWIGKDDAEKAEILLRSKGIGPDDRIICVSPGAKSHIKRWSEKGFAKACDALVDTYNMKVVLAGDSSDKEICERILGGMKNYAVSVAGMTNLRELAWIIKRSRLIITNDSAPLHLAGSMGTPAVAVFGPTDYRKYGPRQGMGEAIYKRLHCSPCESALCKYNLECMKAVGVEDVLDAAKRILDERREEKI